MAVQLIVDSAADIIPSDAQALGIVHLPLKVVFGETEYEDSVNLTHYGFYEKLIESDVFPTTCQIPPADFAAVYERVTANGDTAVVITLSSKLSGTYQSAVIAAQDYEDRVFVVDSLNVALGERSLVDLALRLRDQGLSAKDIATALDEEKGNIRVMALLDTLEYLKKGGRISSAVAFAGSLLSLKPVVAIENGEVAVIGKARGSKQGNNLLRDMVQKGGGIDFDKPFYLAYSGLTDALLRKYIEDSRELWEGQTERLPIITIGCTIGAHVGPGAVAVAFFEKS